MSGTKRATILVVDDEPANRALVGAYLEDGYDVVEAADGAQALEILSRLSVDLVLLDVMMPNMSGIEVCSIIKAKAGDGPYCPVVLLTALGEQEDRNRGLAAGADDFLTKPVDRHELMLRVKLFVKLRQQDHHIRHQNDLIAHQLDELQALDTLKDDLVAMMVHDLRNPLSGLHGFVQVVQMGIATSELQEDAVMALQASQRLRETLDDILRVRMLESGAVALHREIVAASRLIHDAVSSVSGAAQVRQIKISEMVGPTDLTFNADRKLLLRAVENLLSNALKYSPPGAIVEAAVRQVSGEVEIEVADRGAGISDDHKRTLFERFGSVEALRGDERRGFGLGLYLVRLVANAHGGRAVVRDRAGGGTAFALLFPSGPVAAVSA